MNIELFSEVTTEAALFVIESEAEQYHGLYVDMNEGEQRKYVKQKAAVITRLLGQVDRTRIDLAKNYKREVEDEANSIKARLQKANEPFTLLIEGYNEERKRILDAEKEKKRQEELYIQIGLDHEFALLLDKSHAAEQMLAERLQIERDESIRQEGAVSAWDDVIKAQALMESTAEKQKADRLANKEHVRGINRAILVALMQADISEEDAKTVVSLAAKGLAGKLTINY